MNLWNRFRNGLQRTRDAIVGGLGAALGRGGPVDAATLERLEEALLAADVGPDTADRLIERARRLVGAERDLDLRGALERAAADLLRGTGEPARFEPGPGGPWVVLIVGVNGAGKTTFAGKLAARFAREGTRRCWWRPTRSGPRPPSSWSSGRNAPGSRSCGRGTAPIRRRSSTTG